jgi:hypothetical protein
MNSHEERVLSLGMWYVSKTNSCYMVLCPQWVEYIGLRWEDWVPSPLFPEHTWEISQLFNFRLCGSRSLDP